MKCRSICSNSWLPLTLSTARCCCTACKCCWEEKQPVLSSFILSPWEISPNGPTPHTSYQRTLDCGTSQDANPDNFPCSLWPKGKAVQQDEAFFSFYQVYSGQSQGAVSQVSFYMGTSGALTRITHREPSGGKVRVIMATWRRGESHASSFYYSITHSHNSEKTCNSELYLYSLIFPWWFEYSRDTARFAVRVCPAGCEKGQPIFSILFSPVIRWLQCPSVFDIRCSQSSATAWLCCTAASL